MENKEIDQAIEILKNSGIVIYPTDTAFGIGCRIDDEKAIKRLFVIKQRPINQATPVLVDSMEMAKKYLIPFDNDVLDLMKKYWPGALTIVLKARADKVSKLIMGENNTLAVRMPNDKVILSLIKSLGVPIIGTSANLHGENTIYKFKDLDKRLVKKVDFVVKGESLEHNISTVIDCTRPQRLAGFHGGQVQNPWKILRQGVIRI